MAQQPSSHRKRDMSPKAQALRSAVADAKGAREALNVLGGASRLSTGKLRRDAAQADDRAHQAALEYRASHQAADKARAAARKALTPTDAQLDQFERANTINRAKDMQPIKKIPNTFKRGK